MTIKKAELRNTLEEIANSFESIFFDELTTMEKKILRRVTDVLGWQVLPNEAEVKLVRSTRVETEPAIDDAF